MRIKRAFAAGLLSMIPALTGCLVHRHTVLKTHPPDVVLNSSLDDLLAQTNTRYNNLNDMSLQVQISTMTGGSTLPGFAAGGQG